MDKERKKLSPITESALEDWVSSDLETMSLPYSMLNQVAPNRHINVYRVHAPEGDLFTKIYLDKPQIAEDELKHYQYFRNLAFVPALRHTVFPIDNPKRLLSYQFIENDDLHRQFTAARSAGLYPDPSIVQECIQSIVGLG